MNFVAIYAALNVKTFKNTKKVSPRKNPYSHNYYNKYILTTKMLLNVYLKELEQSVIFIWRVGLESATQRVDLELDKEVVLQYE